MGTQNARFVANLSSYQLHQNQMQVYLNAPQRLLINSSSNLFALRWDLPLGLFDQAGFIIVPKLGKLVVHFLQPTHQSAQLYHNVQFDHKDKLSHEALYARFAWVLMKIVNSMAEEFTASGDEESGADEGGNGGGNERDGRSGGGGGRGGHSGGGVVVEADTVVVDAVVAKTKAVVSVKTQTQDENKDDESHYGMGATSTRFRR